MLFYLYIKEYIFVLMRLTGTRNCLEKPFYWKEGNEKKATVIIQWLFSKIYLEMVELLVKTILF